MDMQSSIVSVRSEQQAIDAVKIIANIVSTLRHDVLKPDMDYGVIPGTGSKPTLLLPGMEKLMRALNAVPEYIERCVIRDYDKPLFHYEYECRLVDADTGLSIPGGRGLGMCTSHESAFRWRKTERVCPTCGKSTIIKGKEEYGGGWVCFNKKGGCGAKFKEGDKSIEDQAAGRIENPDIFDQVNAILKRAKKRALGDAVKGAANVSEFFTVDLEDMVYHDDIVVEGTATHVMLPATTTEPPAKTPEQVEAERKAEELKVAQQRLSALVEGMEKNGISLDTAMQVLAIPEDKKYDFDLWKSHGATPKAIAEKVATQLAAGEKPATPKTAKPGISNDDATKLDALCGRWYDTVADSPLAPDVVLGELGKNFWSEFASYEDAKAAAMGWIIGKQLPIVVTGATYHKQYTALANGLIEVRCYDFRKKTTEQLGDMWGVYTAEWVDGGAYPFDKGHQLIVGWAEKKTDKAQYYLAESIKPLPIADVPF
jgi:hypothetical protein